MSSLLMPLRMSASIVVLLSSLRVLGRALESRALASLAIGQGGLVSMTVYLVDNASRAAYREALVELLQGQVHTARYSLAYLPLGENRGFGAGHNAALAAADSDCHLVLNPDAELDVYALARALALFVENPDIVLLSPRVSGPDGRTEYLCKRYPSVLVLLLRGFAPDLLRRPFNARLAHYEMREELSAEVPCDVDIASGCCMLVRTGALRSAGGFDERYFLYFEDFDLSLRLALHGRLVFHPTVSIVHHGGYAARKGWRHVGFFVRSAARFFNQHGWRWW
ncbi:MAG: glycosyltransferase [Halioglobus sp.]